jgi:hypothetical protein
MCTARTVQAHARAALSVTFIASVVCTALDTGDV